jgi:hypothetical protein
MHDAGIALLSERGLADFHGKLHQTVVTVPCTSFGITQNSTATLAQKEYPPSPKEGRHQDQRSKRAYFFIFVHICMRAIMYVYVCINTTSMCAFIHIYIHTYIYINTYTYIYIYIQTYTYIYIYIYIHTYKHTYTYTYAHTHKHSHGTLWRPRCLRTTWRSPAFKQHQHRT